MQNLFDRCLPRLALCLALCASGAGCSSSGDASSSGELRGGASGSLSDGGASPLSVGGAPGGATASSAGAPNGGAQQASAGAQGALAGAANTSGGANNGTGGANNFAGGGAGSRGVGMAGAVGTGGAVGAGGTVGTGGGGSLPNVNVYIAGDSTVSQYVLDPNDPTSWAGWGQMLGPNYDARVTVFDKAVGGRTARRFIQEGTLAAILKLLKPGDYLLVQFGTNDSNTGATYTISGVSYPYYAAADTDFKTYIQQYIDGALAAKAIPVLVTPPPRNSAYCKGGRSLANYGQAMLDLGKADGVAVVDLGLKTHAYLTAICPKPTTGTQEMFFKVNADNSIDGTHFQENGARVMAGFVADGIDEAKLALSAYRKH